MIKVTMLATLFAGLAMGATTAQGVNPHFVKEARDTKIIVEVDRSLESLTEEGISNTQKIVYNNIRAYVTSNVKFENSYSILNNAFVVSINNKYVEAVKNVPGVKSVTVNKMHYVTQSVQTLTDGDPDPVTDYGGPDNASATTMKKPGAKDEEGHIIPGETNDGEGTVIAILDNEFYFKGNYNDGTYHETFTDLASDVKVKFESRPNIKKTHVYTEKDGDEYVWKDKIDAATLGDEGSLYFNRKVPYYFDYGGESESYGGDPTEDFDVSSLISYHGSHVASIAAGNADTYKGIAPKAQLVCMKVFTNFEAKKIDEALGFQSSSGAYDIPILNALEDCITLGVDGINMSLGSNLDDFDADSITMKTLQELADKGILSAISAGNNGKTSFAFAGGYGNWTSEMVETGVLGGYANSEKSMTIASGQPSKTFYASAFKYKGSNISYEDQVVNWGNSTDYDDDEERRISDLVPGPDKTLAWQYIPNFGSSADYVGKDVSGKIAVVNRGSIDFATKVSVAKDKGAIGVVIINNDPTASDFNFHCSFGDMKPTIPVALVLFKEKQTFEKDGSGTFDVVKDEVDINPKANTISTFSSDGAAANFDMKPEITAPGDNIRGAVPPQKKEDKQSRRYSTYEFLSGTSMSAPNYAGAQSVVLSKKASSINARLNQIEARIAEIDELLKDSTLSSDERKALQDEQSALKTEKSTKTTELNTYRKTVDMRLMSTAIPMLDYEECPEQEGQHNQTSPRIQGAGMANIGAAYNTDVYLEGYDLSGNPIGKSKIALRNSSKINDGTVSLSFLAHNEGETARTYEVSYTVMRPAIKKSNEVVSRKYNYRGEVDSISSFPGYSYWVEQVDPDTAETSIVERHATGDVAIGDVFKVTREIEYDIPDDPENPTELIKQKIAIGRYVCRNTETYEFIEDGKKVTWVYATYETLEGSDYQSTQDTLIATKVISAELTIPAGDHKVTLDEYSLTNEQRAEIASFYKYGCYLEGFVTLKSKDSNVPDLSIPWMGFYGGGEGQDANTAPVVEEFGFEKDQSSIYPSELVNDIAYSLLGKTNVDFGSTMATTYIEPGKSFNEDDILRNDESLSHMAKVDSSYHLLGTDADGNYYTNPSEHLYVGNAHSSNTLLVQQFVLRSVDDNYFTITNKESGEVVLQDVLEDMLFGERYNRYPLYKSHVDENYLGGGYVAHRAFAAIPLYDQTTGLMFEAGDYEITFNYLLAGTYHWVSKSYTLHVCSDDPTISSVEVKQDSVKFNISEQYLTSVKVGSSYYQMSEAEIEGNYIELDRDTIEYQLSKNFNEVYGSGRLFIELQNRAYGRTGIIVRFGENKDGSLNLNKYTLVEHYSFALNNDFEDLGTSVHYVTYDSKTYTVKDYSVDNYVRVKRDSDKKPSGGGGSSSGCGGNIVTTSVTLSALAAVLAIALIISKKRKFGGKE